MPALPGCTITDTFAALGPAGSLLPRPGTVVAHASVTPLFVQQQGGAYVEHAHTLVSAVESASGSWTLVLPAQDDCDPASVTWTITLPDGTAWNGAVTAAMVTASQATPLGLHDLKGLYGWGLVAGAAGGAVSAVAGLGVGAPATYWVSIPPSGTVTAYNTQKGTVDASGATSDVVLSALAALLGSTPATVALSPQTHTLAANVTIPATVALQVPAGAVLSRGAHTLTLDGPLDAGPYQIFSGSGSIAFGPGSVEHVYAEWWGARNGGPSDEAAVQAAAHAVSAPLNGYGVVRFLPATYHFAASVECPPHVAFIGAGVDQDGQAGTVITLADGVDGFTWTAAGSNGKTVLGALALRGGRHGINAANLSTFVSYVHLFDLATASQSGAGIHLQGAIEEWFVQRWAHAGGTYGVQMEDIGVPTDAQQASYADKSHFQDCVINTPNENCIKWFCKQGNAVTFEHCVFNTAGQHGVWLDCGVNGYRFVNCSTELSGWRGKNANTTGSISSGSPALSVADAAGFAIGDTIIVRGAAAHGLDLSTQVSAISGTTLTLADSAASTVSGVRVSNAQYDDIYVTNTVAAIQNVAIVGGLWGSEYTGHLRYWINNTLGVRFEISTDTVSAAEAYDPNGWCIAPSSRVAIVRPSDQHGDLGLGIFAPTTASGNAGERASYPSTPGGDWEAVLRASGGRIGANGWLFRKADSNNYAVAQLWPDGTFTPARIAHTTTAMVGATPDVSHADAYITRNTTPTTVTAFTNGQQGQEITLIFGDTNTTIQSNATIGTGTGSPIVGGYATTVSFLLMDGVWYRTGGTA